MKLFNNKILRKEPKVSVILPNYNSSGTIVATINSVLQQTYKNWEILIIDDCSDEKTKNIISKFSKKKKIKIIYLKKNKGAAYCRNFAIKKTRSDYIAFIDSDDLWQKNKLKLQINFMQENSYFFTYTNYKTFKTGSFIKSNILVPVKFDFNSFIKNTSIATSTMIVKRSITNKVKFSNTKICEDYYYKCQLLKRVGLAYCYPGYLTEYQIRKGSLQSNRIKNLYWIWKINRQLNRFNVLRNLISVFFISFNSLKKYGFK